METIKLDGIISIRRQKPILLDLKSILDEGVTLEDAVWKLGQLLGVSG